jgi:hypothetical protein
LKHTWTHILSKDFAIEALIEIYILFHTCICVCLYTMEYYSVIRRSYILIYAITCTIHKNFILCEIRQTQKKTIVLLYLFQFYKICKIIGTDFRIESTCSLEAVELTLVSHECIVSVWDDENSGHAGVVYTAVWQARLITDVSYWIEHLKWQNSTFYVVLISQMYKTHLFMYVICDKLAIVFSLNILPYKTEMKMVIW